MFAEILQMKIRKGDVVMQSKSNRFFIILPELTEENTDKFLKRIEQAWENTQYSKNFKIGYRMKNKNYADTDE